MFTEYHMADKETEPVCAEREADEKDVRLPFSDRELAELLNELRVRKETVTTVESCTGGMISGRITDIPGSSDVLKMAFVTYCDEAKHRMVGVRTSTLERYTAVSRQVCSQMARGGAKRAHADAALAVTGYAGPPWDPEDDTVGLVYAGCFYRGKVSVKELHLTGTRDEIRKAAVQQAFLLLKEALSNTD